MSDGPEWWFYHLERSGPERAAGPLLEKCLERGWRVLAVSSDERRRAALDEALWTYSDESFLRGGDRDRGLGTLFLTPGKPAWYLIFVRRVCRVL